MKLSEAAVGSTVIVKKIEAERAIKKRFMDMGITKQTQIYIKKVAPLKDPIEITLRGYDLTLRKDEAQQIEVE